MTTTGIAGILEGCAFFSQLDRESRQRLARMAERRRFAKGQMIFRDGEEATGLHLVVEGLVRVYKLAPSGKEHVLHLAGPGMTFAEVAVLGGFPLPAYAEAVEPTACVVLPTRPFLQALREDHRLCLQILSSMAIWIRSLVSLLEGIVLRDAAGRVAGYLLETQARQGGRLALPGLKKHIASHLNLTSETLSRTLRQLKEQGLIREARGRVTVQDAEGLRTLTEGYFPRL